MKWKFLLAVLLAALLACVLYARLIALPAIDADMNRVDSSAPVDVTERAAALHQTLRVADLHADTTLWQRDPGKRQTRGHVDLPRLVEGGVDLQVFSATTKSPAGQNYNSNTGGTDKITQLAIAQAWPPRTWTSLYERAVYQASRLERLERGAAGAFKFVRSRRDLDAALESGAVAGIFLIEGGHPLEGDIEKLDGLYDAGLRIVGLQHFFDNALGGSLHGVSKAGLTDFGRAVVARAEAKSMIIDVAHSSEASVRDVLAMATRPVIVSHTGLNGHCQTPRNISDALMSEIAAQGGLIGIGFWSDVVCGGDPAAIAAAVVYAIDLLGPEHVALGSDFDGTVTTPIDASQMAAITSALLDAGLDEATIRLVMGENAIRFFREYLPD